MVKLYPLFLSLGLLFVETSTVFAKNCTSDADCSFIEKCCAGRNNTMQCMPASACPTVTPQTIVPQTLRSVKDTKDLSEEEKESEWEF